MPWNFAQLDTVGLTAGNYITARATQGRLRAITAYSTATANEDLVYIQLGVTTGPTTDNPQRLILAASYCSPFAPVAWSGSLQLTDDTQILVAAANGATATTINIVWLVDLTEGPAQPLPFVRERSGLQ